MSRKASNRPELECDVIMAGGITSGVVFPCAILKLKEKYAFRSIGGTSAGAIAAAIAAAAEFGRRGGFPGAAGFDAVEAVPGELQKNLESLFQPTREHRRLFGFLVSLIGVNRQGWLRMALTVLFSAAQHFWLWALFGLLFWAIALVGPVTALFKGILVNWLKETLPSLAAYAPLLTVLAAVAFAFMLAFLCAASLAGSTLIGFLRSVSRLKESNYGICPGVRQADSAPGLIDWIDSKITDAAGVRQNEKGEPLPLTFGDLAGGDDHKSTSIHLRLMTSNLTHGTGEVLPSLGGQPYYFTEREMRAILPAYVVDHMTRPGAAELDNGAEMTTGKGEPLFRLPAENDMPVILAVRMSLNFPVLFTAVPLYAWRYWGRQAASSGTEKRLERLLFSDGGITSNFPVRFFDALIPSRPTFGISLDDFPLDEKGEELKHPRVYLPMKPGAGRQPQSKNIDSLSGFLFAIVNTAREWQDRKQGAIAGFRERVSHIFLKNDEGGLRLKMPEGLIKDLGSYGARAGALMTAGEQQPQTDGPPDESNFDFSDHQWRRFLIAYAQMEALLENTHKSWKGHKDRKPIREAILALLQDPATYAKAPIERRRQIFARMDALVELFENAIADPPEGSPCGPKGVLRDKEDWFPAHRAKLQIVSED